MEKFQEINAEKENNEGTSNISNQERSTKETLTTKEYVPASYKNRLTTRIQEL